MGTITINVSDQTEQRFREAVKEYLGIGKGKLGSAITEALQFWIQNKKQEEISQRQIQWLKKGFHLGKSTFNREKLHERTN